jgi:hypothetical protein
LSKSNKCTEHNSEEAKKLTGGSGRMPYVVEVEARALEREVGVERLGFLTLTFAEHITDIKEAQRRFRSLRTHIVSQRYGKCINVWERQRSGRLHCHLLLQLPEDIRTGFNFDQFNNGKGRARYSSANDWLKREWALWRSVAPAYGFGRHRLEPIRTNGEGIGRYLSKYLTKGLEARWEADKGAHLVSFIGYGKKGEASLRKASLKFSFNSEGSWTWRRKVETFSSLYGVKDWEGLRLMFGVRWAYELYSQIQAMPVGTSPKRQEEACKALGEDWETFLRRPVAKKPPVFIEAHVASMSFGEGQGKYVERPSWDIASESVLARGIAKARAVVWVKALPQFKPWMIETQQAFINRKRAERIRKPTRLQVE